FRAYQTAGMGDATKLTERFLNDGADLIVCVGGDGTLNEVINGFMNEEGPSRPDALLGFVPNGTGCDFCKTIPIPNSIDRSLDTIRESNVRTIDLGRLRYVDMQGNARTRYFHNITSFGLGGEVDARVNRTSKAFGPFLSFIWATLISIFLYGKKRIRLAVDDEYDEEITILNVAVANGKYHGGGMYVAPEALVDDGLFHVTVIGDLSLPEIFYHLPKLYNGKIGTMDKVFMVMGRQVGATSDQTVLLDVDGEQPGKLPVRIEIVPKALRLITDKL
ncbi:MAG: diacylglycerol kinase family lipid kinase, partial [Deltaproteobacteria bacterium]|nr:diacylglycerol kinase family lipid kinase [Deltaproteobacteria bacterium]